MLTNRLTTLDGNDYTEDDMDEDEEFGITGRTVFNLYLDENNKVPTELARLNATDFEIMYTSQDVKYEILMPSIFLNKVYYLIINFHSN